MYRDSSRQLFLVLAIAGLLATACSAPDRPVEPAVRPQPESPVTAAPQPSTRQDHELSEADQPLRLQEYKRHKPAAAESVVGGVMHHPGAVPGGLRVPSEPVDRERYAHLDPNPLHRVAEQPVSTFSIDVDTGSYANVRRFLRGGSLPPQDAVRVEEMINYFRYAYPVPTDRGAPFNVLTDTMVTPWNPKTRLLRIGIKGYDVPAAQRPPANLVFLVDVSGSMRSPEKLELLKSSLKLLGRQMRATDRVAIAVYAGASGVVLEPVPGNARARIAAALDGLQAGGSTNGGAGIRLAYNLARQSWIDGGINRVILATDGDFNVGTVNFEALKDLVERERRSGISLTTLGFGTGNYNDHLMEQLADAGNGNHAYIDTLNEANKVLVDQMSSTLQTIASDVKIQIEFNPARVAEYRLIGYENRMLKREDFSNDAVDAGEIGAGHTVTALYEIALTGEGGERIEPLRYGTKRPAGTAGQEELAHLRIRHKLPGSEQSRLQEWPIRADLPASEATEDLRFAAAVAAFGQLLTGGRYLNGYGYEDILRLTRSARGSDPFGYRGEFVGLVGLAKSLDARQPLARQ